MWLCGAHSVSRIVSVLNFWPMSVKCSDQDHSRASQLGCKEKWLSFTGLSQSKAAYVNL